MTIAMAAKRLDRPAFWMWAVPLVLGFGILSILALSAVNFVGRYDVFRNVATALAFVRLVVIVLLAMALARRFRDIGWPVWIGPTILLVTQLGQIAYDILDPYDSRSWDGMGGWTSDFVSLGLLVVAGLVPGKPAPAEVAHVFD